MSTYHGNDGSITIGANAIAKIRSWSVNLTKAIADDTGMGDSDMGYKPGHNDGTGEATCLFDHDDTTGQDALMTAFLAGTTVALNLYPAGNTSGRKKVVYTAALLTGCDFTGELTGIPEFSIKFQGVPTVSEVT